MSSNWLLVKVTLLEVFLQLEEPVENPENFFFVQKRAILAKKEITKVQWGSADVDVTLKTQDLYFNSNCQWVHLVGADHKHK